MAAMPGSGVEDDRQLLKDSNNGRSMTEGAGGVWGDLEAKDTGVASPPLAHYKLSFAYRHRWLLTAVGVALATGLVILVHSLATRREKGRVGNSVPPAAGLLQPCKGAYSLCYQLPYSLRSRLNVEIFYWSEQMNGPYLQANIPLLRGIETKDEANLILLTQSIAASLTPVNVTLDSVRAEDHVLDGMVSQFPYALSVQGPTSPALQASANQAASVLGVDASPLSIHVDILLLGTDAPPSRILAASEAELRLFQGAPGVALLRPTTFTATELSLWYTPVRAIFETTSDIEGCLSLWEHVQIFPLGAS